MRRIDARTSSETDGACINAMQHPCILLAPCPTTLFSHALLLLLLLLLSSSSSRPSRGLDQTFLLAPLYLLTFPGICIMIVGMLCTSVQRNLPCFFLPLVLLRILRSDWNYETRSPPLMDQHLPLSWTSNEVCGLGRPSGSCKPLAHAALAWTQSYW